MKPLGASMLLLVGIASAPAPLAQQNDKEIEEIIVTGSRIPRRDFESASPIVTIASEDFKRSATTSVEAALSGLPQFVPGYGSSSNNPGIGGKATVQLRGLGAQATLVLLDGRRLIPADGAGEVDVNIIPHSLIERVEVISGGASAVYGSDAVAGVVNFKLKQDFEGVEVDGSWSQTGQEDGEEQYAGITAGLQFAEGRGHAYGYLGYTDREAVDLGQREFSKYALQYYGAGSGGIGPDGGFLASGSATVAEGRVSRLGASRTAFDTVFARYGYAPGSVPYIPSQSNVAINADGTVFTTGDNSTPGSVANYRGERDPLLFNDRLYSYNFAPWNYLQLPLERSSAFGRASFELAAGTEVYAQVLYADYSADVALAPTPAFPLYMPRSNPYISADLGELLDSRPDPDADLRMTKRFVEVGPRIATNDYQVYQATVGLSGELFMSWHYDAYVQHGDNDQREEQQGNVLRSRVFELSYAPDGGQSICGEFDLFRVGHISSECVDYVSAGGANRSGYKQSIAEFSATGPVWTLPAGELKLAFGALYKRDEFFYQADPIGSIFLFDDSSDIQGFTATDDIDGSDHNTDFYVEASVPLLANRPGVQSLETLLGYRHTEYAAAGGADAWKAELLYRPVDTLRLRGSLQEAVRAPSVYELYLPRLPVVYATFDLSDPCTAGSPQRRGPNAAGVEALCLAQGVPAEVLADFAPVGDYFGVSGGNTALEPESASTATLGFVLDPAFEHPLLADMQLAVDWYRIEVDEAIESVDVNTYVPSCFDPATNPEMATSGYWCGFFSRDPATGELTDLLDTLVNFGSREVSGIDVQIAWHIPAGPGRINVRALASWLDQFKLEPAHGLPPDELVGLVGGGVGGSLPEWKLSLRLIYEWKWLSTGVHWRYIGAMHDTDQKQAGKNYGVPSYDYYNLFVEGSFDTGTLEGLTLRVGVENLTDEDPPLLPSQVQANTDPSQYDVLGRRYYLNLSYRF